MEVSATIEDEQRETGYLGLIGLLLGLTLGAGVLYLAGGPPHLPHHVPSWGVVVTTLKGSSLPLDVVAYVLTTLAWLVWLWIVASLLLRLLVACADGLSRGASWVGTFRAVSDRVTLPLVRRAVDSALVAIFVVNMVSRTVPGAAAATVPRVVTHPAAVQPRASAHGSPPKDREQHVSPYIEYTVQPGDCLWAIAQRFYRSGEEYPRLVAANVGRHMQDGEYFTETGVIQPGWILRVPRPSTAVLEEHGIPYYVVEEGDTLQGIAARLLGSEGRWIDLFDLNRDKAGVDGHVLTDPNLIWPGLRLQVPLPSSQTPVHPVGAAAGGSAPRGTRITHAPPSPPITPTPTRVPATPTPLPRATTPPPTAASTLAAHPTATSSKGPAVGFPGDETDVIAGIAAAATVVAACGVLVARRRARRSLDEPPIPAPPPPRPIQEFADIDPARSLAHRVHGGESEQVSLVAFQIYRFLAKHALQALAILLAEQEHDEVALTLRGGTEDQRRLGELAGELEQRLGCKVRVSQTSDGDMALQVGSGRLLGLVGPIANHSSLLPLFPLGALAQDRTLYGNWRELGNVLIAAMPSGGAEVILATVLATLAARCSPRRLQLWTIADHRLVPPQLRELPHQCVLLDSARDAQATAVLEDLRKELRRRIREVEQSGQAWSASTEDPELVLVLGELGELPDDEGNLDFLATQGPAHGIRALAATTRAETLGEDVLGFFRTRLVLQAFDEDESIHVLGQPEATDLGSGEFLLQIDRRHPIRLRGFRIDPECLDELVRLMRDTHGPVVWDPIKEPPDREGIEEDALEAEEAQSESASAEATPAALEPEPASSETAGETPSSHDAPELLPDSSLLDEEGLAATEGALEGEALTAAEGHEPGDARDGQVEHVSQAEMWLDPSGTTDVQLTANGAHESQPQREPLIHIQCFGDFVVRSGDKAISPSGGEKSSYKAWELLAFLGSQPGGAVSKEKLLAAVWPDVGGEERVTNKVNAALGRLRTIFGRQVAGIPSEVVRLGRDGTCRLDTTRVLSDVHEFVSLLRAAQGIPLEAAISTLEQARRLYKGELLSGWETREYEWVYSRDESGVTLREHYREEYQRATKRLARLYREAGRPDLAVPLLKELLQAEPTLEDVVRELYQCYRDLGDLTSLIREDRHLRQALREVYGSLGSTDRRDVPPEPETVRLFQEVRQELESEGAQAQL